MKLWGLVPMYLDRLLTIYHRGSDFSVIPWERAPGWQVWKTLDEAAQFRPEMPADAGRQSVCLGA
jgi:hypothetical protein